jgi:hypothetical protein
LDFFLAIAHKHLPLTHAAYPRPAPSSLSSPDCLLIQVGEIIGRFEKKGMVLKGLKVFQCPKELAEEHYEDLSSKPFFGDLVEYIISGPVICMVGLYKLNLYA